MQKNWGMSSVRSASVGKCNKTTPKRKNRSTRKRPSMIAISMFWCVAEMIRTSTGRALLPQTRDTNPSSNTRSSFTYMSKGMSPISSKNNVLLSAFSKCPERMACAPVKAPCSKGLWSWRQLRAGRYRRLTASGYGRERKRHCNGRANFTERSEYTVC